MRLPKASASVGLFEPFSFAYVTDVHLATHQTDTYEMLQESQLFLQDVVKTLNEQTLDFVLFGGDQVQGPGKDDTNWQLFLDVVQSLNAPWTFVLGDRDISGSRLIDKMRTFGPDWKGKGIETTKPYWSQSPLPGVHLIGLDTSRANSTIGDISKEQLDWLRNDLVTNSRRFTIVLSHHPLLPPPPYDGGPPWDDYIVNEGSSAREILGSSKYVRLALSGHVHVSKIQQERDIWYVSNPSLAVYPCGFRLFHVTPDEITIETYQVGYPALVKKAHDSLSSSPLAFKYNSTRPASFAELCEGSRLDQNALVALGPGGTVQPLRPNGKKKKNEKPSKEVANQKHKNDDDDRKSAKSKSDDTDDRQDKTRKADGKDKSKHGDDLKPSDKSAKSDDTSKDEPGEKKRSFFNRGKKAKNTEQPKTSPTKSAPPEDKMRDLVPSDSAAQGSPDADLPSVINDSQPMTEAPK